MTAGQDKTKGKMTLHDADRRIAELRERHPGWNVWFVPHSEGGITWCAQPRPLINTDSPEHLSEEIREAEQQREPAARSES